MGHSRCSVACRVVRNPAHDRHSGRAHLNLSLGRSLNNVDTSVQFGYAFPAWPSRRAVAAQRGESALRPFRRKR